ncbi:MAG: hypothetical protein ABL933_00410 [Methyloglobulus sp.]|nr:hypothetical protein [Methyloglobulus sp.]
MAQAFKGLFIQIPFGQENRVIFLLAGSACLELFAYMAGGYVARLAAMIWIAQSLLAALCVSYWYVENLLNAWNKKQFPFLITHSIILCILTFVLGSPQIADVSPEAALQAGAGIDAFSSIDFNYNGKAFLGYPARQYLLVALPSKLFGSSLFALHLGFAWLFIIGFMAFSVGLQRLTARLGRPESLALVPISLLFSFPFIPEYYLIFEQTILPISLTLFAIGIVLIALDEFSPAALIALAWVSAFLSHTYTPALAALGLLLVSLLLLCLKPSQMDMNLDRHQLKKVFLAIFGYAVIFLLATVLAGREDRVAQLRESSSAFDLLTSVLAVLTDRNVAFFGVLDLPILAYLIASLLGFFGRIHFLVSVWVIGVLMAALQLQGYTQYDVASIMQRALIILPVLLTAMYLIFLRWMASNSVGLSGRSACVIALSALIVLFSNVLHEHRSFRYLNSIVPFKFILNDMNADIKKMGVEQPKQVDILFFTDNQLMTNLKDYARYLFPAAHVYVSTDKAIPNEVANSKNLLIYGDESIAGGIAGLQLQAVGVKDVRTGAQVKYYRGRVE